MKARHHPVPRTDADRAERTARQKKHGKGLAYDVDRVLIDAILDARPALRAERHDIVHGIAQVFVASALPIRRHSQHEGYFSLHSLELLDRFGRDRFQKLNELYELVDVVKEWEGDQTYAYRFRPDFADAVNSRIDSFNRTPSALTEVILPDGTIERSRHRNWSARHNMQGLRNARALVGKGTLVPVVPVDMEALLWLDDTLLSAEGADDPTRAAILTRLELAPDIDIKRLRGFVRSVIKAGKDSQTGYGRIQHEYFMQGTGRLFAKGLNLQSAPKIVKRFAFRGMFQYDFSNCHFTIIQQLIARDGKECPTLVHYLNNKKKLRAQLAEAAGATIDEIKECLIAVGYGAGISHRSQDSIPQVLGRNRALALYRDPFFRRLTRELDGIHPSILKPYSSRRWGLRNAVGLLFDEKKKRKKKGSIQAKRQAHVLQGIEAQALLAILRTYHEQVLLLEHDGFIGREELDADEVQAVVTEATGFELKLEAERLALPTALSTATTE